MQLHPHDLDVTIYQSFDIDGSGTLDVFEVRQTLASLGYIRTDLQVKELLREIRTTNPESISQLEFTTLMIHLKQVKLRAEEVRILFLYFWCTFNPLSIMSPLTLFSYCA